MSAGRKKLGCRDCSLAQLCLPPGVEDDDLDALERLVKRRRSLKRGEHLFYIGTPFQSLYAVRSGSVKSYAPTEDGQEQVLGFHLPGELIGVDVLTRESYPVAAKALEPTSLCEIPFAQLDRLSDRVPAMQRHLRNILARELDERRELFLVLGRKTAEERLAGLLHNLANRYSQRGFSTSEFNLSMSRNDIANYLGLAVETVSRLFSRFQEEKLLAVERKHVLVRDPARLEELARRAPVTPPGAVRGGDSARPRGPASTPRDKVL